MNISAKLRSLIYASFISFMFTFVVPVHAQIQDWGGCVVDGVPTLKCMEVVFANLLVMSNGFIILALFIMFIIGSFKYLTSFGDAKKIEGARGTFKWAIIGLILYVSSYLILRTIDILFLGGQGNIFRFTIGM